MACRAWLGAILKDMNVRVYNHEAAEFRGRELQGQIITISRSEAALDLYCCGFPCQPWSSEGPREGWSSDKAQCFFSAVKTMQVLRPRAVVSENVVGLSNNSGLQVIANALKTLPGYVMVDLKANSSDHYLPQQRNRIYIVAWRRDALKPALEDSSPKTLKAYMQKKLSKSRQPCKLSFCSWFEAHGRPLLRAAPEVKSETSAACTCKERRLCRVHSCRCKKCKEAGRPLLTCKWRLSHLQFMRGAAARKQRLQYLNKWRRVRQDPALKKAPCYFELATQRGLNTAFLKSPRERCMLTCLSKMQNLMTDKVIFNLGKSIGRAQVRSDGLVPTMTSGCTGRPPHLTAGCPVETQMGCSHSQSRC